MKVFVVISLCMISFAYAHHDDPGEHLSDTLVEEVDEKLSEFDFAWYNVVDTLIKNCLQRIITNIKPLEPYPIPDFPTQEVHDKNVHLNITLTNVKENQLSSLIINKIKGSTFSMRETFDVTLPSLELNGNYVVKGTVLGLNVHGTGVFDVLANNLHTWGTAQAHIVDDYVQLKSLTIDYTVETVTATATGLNVEGLPKKLVQSLLSKALRTYLTNNEPIVSASISNVVIKEVNKDLQGMTFSDLLNWLRHIKI